MSTPVSGPALMRWSHEECILETFRRHGALSRAELASYAGLSRTTLSEIVGGLVRRGALQVVATDAKSRRGSGRPAELLALDPRSGQHLGIDLAHNAVHVTVVDATRRIIASEKRDTDPDVPWVQRVRAALDVLGEIEEGGTRFSALQGVGVGLPGPYSPAWSNDRTLAHTESLEARRIVEAAILERFGMAPVMDTNTRLAALAEADHRPDLGEDLIYVRVAGGIGGGVVVGGRLVHGSRGLAGEFGHIGMADGGRTCSRCGKHGCLETVASLPSILQSCRELGLPVQNPAELSAAVDRGEPIAATVLAEAGAATGRALAGSVLALNPTAVVVGGPLARIAPVFVEHVASTIAFEVRSIGGAQPRVQASDLGDDGGALGAILSLVHRSALLAGYPVGDGSSPSITPMNA